MEISVLRLKDVHTLKQTAHTTLDLLVKLVALHNLAVQVCDVVLKHALFNVPMAIAEAKGAQCLAFCTIKDNDTYCALLSIK
jgi:hypothetical protein